MDLRLMGAGLAVAVLSLPLKTSPDVTNFHLVSFTDCHIHTKRFAANSLDKLKWLLAVAKCCWCFHHHNICTLSYLLYSVPFITFHKIDCEILLIVNKLSDLN